MLSCRALNRATLARQLLLERSVMHPLRALEHLAGLQGQVPVSPYVGLWSRLTDFSPPALSDLVVDSTVVRATVMRGTLHLLGADDYRWIRPLLQPLLARLQRGFMGRQTEGLDLARVVAEAQRLLSVQPLSRSELRRLLGARWPDRDAGALMHSVQYLLPIVQMPPAGTWNGSVTGLCALAESVLGPLAELDPARLVRRYLEAAGPASVIDLQRWCGLTRMADVVETLRGELVVFYDERGRELFDLPEAPRPGEDVPAPVRFLPEYDNLLLSHADRTRVISDGDRARVITSAVAATMLVDGFVRGTWTVAYEGEMAVLRLQLFHDLPPRTRREVLTEAEQLLRFTDPDAARYDVRAA